MALDASIPLSFQPTTPPPSINSLLPIIQFAQEKKKQNALSQILNNANNIDPTTGLPNAQAISQVMKIDPATGIKLATTSAELTDQRKEGQQKQEALYAEMKKKRRDEFTNLIQDRIDKFGLDKAVEMSKSDYRDMLDELVSDGLPKDDVAKAPQDLTPALAQQFVAAALTPEQRAAQKAKKDDAAEKKREFNVGAKQDDEKIGLEREKIKSEEGKAPLAEYSVKGPDGKETTMLAERKGGKWFDANGKPIVGDVTGKPTAAQQGAGFTPEMGSLMASLAEKGVAIPAGLRSKAQQVELYQGLLDRNPNKTPDQIADMVKNGQIEFGAQKKETQTAAGVAGKVEVFANEIEQMAPLISEASKNLPRGKFVPINKLLQTADSAISDPDLKELKVYVNSIMNAYDGLSARGGTDQDKRAAARALITTADSPEALERGLKAFQKEADIAHKAAIKATKVPELEDADKGDTKKGGSPDSSEKSDTATKRFKYDAQGNLVPQ